MNTDNPEDPNQGKDGDPLSDYQDDDYGYDEQSGEYYDTGQDQLAGGGPTVSSSPGRSVILIILAGAIIFFLLYLIIGGDEEEEEIVQEEAPIKIAPATPPPLQLPPPPVPEVKKEEVSSLPPPPPPPIEDAFPLPPMAEFEETGVNDEVLQARRRSDMLIVNARGNNDAAGAPPEGGLENPDPNSAFASKVFRSSASKSVQAGNLGDLHSTIAQGKVVHVVLETAINTDLPGSLRAVVSRDIYAEAGHDPLIPKGSRLIGTYNTDVLFGQGRVFIIWTRIIRPDGVDIMVNSPGIDRLGRGGAAGKVDNKYFEIYSAALLTSALNIGAAVAVESVTDAEKSTTQGSNGSTTTTTSPTTEAALDAVSRIGSVTGRMVDRVINIRPTITIDQGTPLNVFVNHDLVFPPDARRRMQIIP